MKFVINKEFKNTPIGKIPKDWETVKLSEIAKIIMGQSPPSSTYNNIGEGLPFLQGKLEFGDVYPSPRIYCSDPIKIAEAGDILISVRAPVGDVNLAPYKLCIGRGLAVIRINAKKGKYKFYFYYLQKEKDSWEKLSKGSTFKAINKSDIENFIVPLPPLLEQEKIAEILSTIDSAIEKVNEEISKIEQLKKGLMQELLTKGIGHKEFKDTEIGKIPKDWEISKIESLMTLKNGERPKISTNMEIPIYGANGIMGYTKDFLVNNEFTIIIGRVGASGEVHIGRGKIWVSDNAIYSFSYKKEKIYPPFIYYMLKLKNLKQFAVKTTHPIITQTFLNSIYVPCPTLSEQQKIAQILSTVDEFLDLKRKKKGKLVELKKGLMNLLLTGKVRVIE